MAPQSGRRRDAAAVLSREFEDSPSVWERRACFSAVPPNPTEARAEEADPALEKMGERKVQQAHPGFRPVDPAVEEEGWRQAQSKIRMMLHEHLLQHVWELHTKGTKFNARKEDAIWEEYFGLKVFRFYFRCSRCSGRSP